MKKEKMKLDALKVQSFVTSIEEQQKQTVDGGITPTPGIISATIASYNLCGPFGRATADEIYDHTIEWAAYKIINWLY